MANKEHLEILTKGGVVEWNKFIQRGLENEDKPLFADLSGADLSKVDLSVPDFSHPDFSELNKRGQLPMIGANLSRANLNRANLSRTHLDNVNFNRATFIEANFSNAILSNVDLSFAMLNFANFFKARCYGVNFSESRLFDVDFSCAIIMGTDFSKASFAYTVFAFNTFSHLKGLEEAKHYGPSSFGNDILFRHQEDNRGKLPEEFLSDAGVPRLLLDYIPSFIGKPWDYYSCFISYSSKNQDIADRIHSDLEKNGIRCWLATQELKIGDKFRCEIDNAIKSYDKLLLILSETSIASEWVEDEVESALEKERKIRESGNEFLVLFPVKIDDFIMETEQAWAAKIRRSRHIGDFTTWKANDDYEKAFNRLLRDLKNGKNRNFEA